MVSNAPASSGRRQLADLDHVDTLVGITRRVNQVDATEFRTRRQSRRRCPDDLVEARRHRIEPGRVVVGERRSNLGANGVGTVASGVTVGMEDRVGPQRLQHA